MQKTKTMTIKDKTVPKRFKNKKDNQKGLNKYPNGNFDKQKVCSIVPSGI